MKSELCALCGAPSEICASSSRGEFQSLECGQHLTLKVLIMDVQRMKDLRRTTALEATDSGQYRFDHLLAQDQQRRQRSDAGSAHSTLF